MLLKHSSTCGCATNHNTHAETVCALVPFLRRTIGNYPKLGSWSRPVLALSPANNATYVNEAEKLAKVSTKRETFFICFWPNPICSSDKGRSLCGREYLDDLINLRQLALTWWMGVEKQRSSVIIVPRSHRPRGQVFFLPPVGPCLHVNTLPLPSPQKCHSDLPRNFHAYDSFQACHRNPRERELACPLFSWDKNSDKGFANTKGAVERILSSISRCSHT